MPTVILVRHGEVANPNHVVYGHLPGFDLSPLGVLQAHATGAYLAHERVDVVLSSPLARARHTATAIADHHGQLVHTDERLTETRMYPEWTGLTWEVVEQRFPEQFNGYLTDATALRDVTESVNNVAVRTTDTVNDAFAAGHETVVVVGHQDPTQALRLSLLGLPLSNLRVDPPMHGSAITLTSPDGAPFKERSVWNPTVVA